MFTLTEIRSFSKPSTIGVYETAEEALEKAKALGAIYIEEDRDHPGCFDMITARGSQFAIEGPRA